MRAEKWRPWKLGPAILGAAFALLVGPGVSVAQANSSIIPPNAAKSATFGKTYAEWSAAWWQWSLGISVHKPPFSDNINHPLFDTTGAQCSVGQTGPVWFLGGAFSENGAPATKTITRDGCTV